MRGVLLLIGLILAAVDSAEAQQQRKVHRIGYLAASDPTSDSVRSEAIQLALRELGYIEGKNIVTEYRYLEGKLNRIPELTAELVKLKVDLIVVAGADPVIRGGDERDQDNSPRYDRTWARSGRSRPD